MALAENLKKRTLDRKLFALGSLIAFIGFFIPFIAFERKATLNQVLERVESTENVKFNERYDEEIPLSAEELSAAVEKAEAAAAEDAEKAAQGASDAAASAEVVTETTTTTTRSRNLDTDDPSVRSLMRDVERTTTETTTTVTEGSEAAVAEAAAAADAAADKVAAAASANSLSAKAAALNVKTTKTVEKTRRAFRQINEEKVRLPTSGFAKVSVDYLEPLSDEIQQKFDPKKDESELLISKIDVMDMNPTAASEPNEPAKPKDESNEEAMKKYNEDLTAYKTAKDAYDEKRAQSENTIRELEKISREISSEEGAQKDAMKFDKSQIQYKGASDELGKTKVHVRYTLKNIFAAATFFNYADNQGGYAYNSTFLVALWLCTIAGIVVFLLSNGIVMDVVVWLIGAGFGLASVIKLPQYLTYLTDEKFTPIFSYTIVGGYIIFIGWTLALVGVILSLVHVKAQGIRKTL